MNKKIYILSSLLLLSNVSEAIVIDKTKNQKIISPILESNQLENEINKYQKKNKKFENKFYYVWNINHRSPYKKKDAMWPFYLYTNKKVYKENLQPYSKYFWNKIKINANFDDFGKLRQYAVSTNRLMLRNFPTEKPIFYNPDKEGEGYPFSYNDNSAVHPNEPLMISHFSKDKKFVYAMTSYAGGWVKTKNIVIINDKIAKKLKNSEKIVLTVDNISILDKKHNYLFSSKIGMILPILEEKPTYFKALIVTYKEHLKPKLVIVNIPKKIAHFLPTDFNNLTIKKNSNKMLNNEYGWGGSTNDRDCSSTLKDLMATTGIWLPRNSRAIATEFSNQTSLRHMKRNEKEQFIINNATPYQTVLYMKGHIMLYIGSEKGKVKIFHNLWGVGIIEKGKYKKKIIGKTIISDLYVGKEYRKKKFLIDSLTKMTLLK